DLTGIRVFEGAGPGALPRGRADSGAVLRGVQRRPAQEVAAQPLAAVPRLPGRQAGVRVHAVGHPVVLVARLAEALLPARRRVRRDLAGVSRHDRVRGLWPRQEPALCELHGALRVRTERGVRDDGLAQGVAARCSRLLALGEWGAGRSLGRVTGESV